MRSGFGSSLTDGLAKIPGDPALARGGISPWKFARAIRYTDVLDSRTMSVVIGLAGTYLALSLIVLCLVEMISSALSRRARFLRDAIVNLIGAELGSRVLSNGLVSSLGFTRLGGRAVGLPSYIPSSFFARALFMEIQKAPEDRAVTAVKEIISAAVGDASVSVEEAERRLAVWFDAAMDRLTGAFKRNTQRVSLVVSILLVVAANIDSIRLTQALWNDAGARARMEALSNDEMEACQADSQSPACSEVLGALASGDFLPLGWDLETIRDLDIPGVGLLLLGLALTVLAASKGAPFWFDILRRFSAGLVSTGPRPAPAASSPPPPRAPPAVSVKVEDAAGNRAAAE